jgi:hypothetical protein
MISMRHTPKVSSCKLAAAFAVLAFGIAPLAAAAQTMDYGNPSGGESAGPADAGSASGSRGERPRGGRSGSHISPYIEAQQVVSAQLSPGSDVLTYSQIAAGVDATVTGRNSAASLSLRYERRIGWGDAGSGDTISGIARGYLSIVPQTLRLDAGVLAARTRVEQSGASVLGPLGDSDADSKVYSVYAGPSLTTRVGDANVSAHYRIGYTKVDSSDALSNAPGQPVFDIFDESIAHDAGIHIATKAGTVLPVGIGAGAGYRREDISNLDQRVEDMHARLDLTLPVSPTFAVMAGVGYEDVTISARDALRDGAGVPVVSGGRFVTDKSTPRTIAYKADGLIWDAGVMWRPSRRTQLEAHVGRRYGTTSYYGTFSYAPNDRSSLNVRVYDNVAGFGGQVSNALAALPAEFSVNRNPLSGDVSGCVAAVEAGNCLNGALGSVRSATFRARGIGASYNLDLGRISAGIGAGYDRRKFIAAPGTVLATANGVIDENIWLAAYLNGRIDRNSRYAVNLYANWFQSGATLDGNATALGASLAYYRNLTDRLTATAALGIDGISRSEPLEDQWAASALVGLRYNF